ERQQWLRDMKQQVLSAARRQMETYMAENAALDYADLRFPLFYFSGDSSHIENLNRAFDRARDAFAISMETGITQEADQMLNEVANVWERELSALAHRKGDPADWAPVRLALHRNLTQVYFYLRKFDLARRNDAMAIAR